MNRGGKRKGAGRKKVGTVINTRITLEILEMIEEEVPGKTRAEKIRNCLESGLLKYREELNRREI